MYIDIPQPALNLNLKLWNLSSYWRDPGDQPDGNESWNETNWRNPGVCVFRVLVIHRYIVLGTHVVCDVVIHDQPRQSFEIEEFE